MCVPSTLFAIDAKRTHAYNTYNRIACTTALLKLPDTLGSAPFRKICVPSLPKTDLARMMFRRTAGQSSSVLSRNCPRYQKVSTLSTLSSPYSPSRLNSISPLISITSAVCFGRHNNIYTKKTYSISVSAPKHSKHRR